MTVLVRNDQPCPFCGSHEVRYVPRTWRFEYEKVYCDGCRTEMEYYPTHIATVWNRRAETDGEHCPMCGGEVEYDGPMNHMHLFPDVYCPTCRVRFEFQRSGLPGIDGRECDPAKVGKWRDRCVAKARKAFGRRAG